VTLREHYGLPWPNSAWSVGAPSQSAPKEPALQST
jgi:hypothetical protein